MLRRSRRPAALVAPLAVLAGLLAACGSEEGAGGFETAERLDAVTIEGEVGQAPTIEWQERMTAGDVESTTAVEGDGAALADGDKVFVNFLLGDGYTRETPVDTFGEGAAAVELTVGGEPIAEPMALTDVVSNFLLDQVTAGVTRGSRLVITGDTPAIFGDLALSPALAADNIGNDDGLLVVADVLDVEPLPGPEGPRADLPGWAPRILFENGLPSAFNFEGVAKPEDKLLSAVIREGSGDVVEKGDLIVADYLGQVYDGDAPFDESYSKEPITTPIGLGGVVKGWDKKLVGVPVGSRVLLRIPPADGYGKEGQGETIPPNSTLYFVVDLLAAA